MIIIQSQERMRMEMTKFSWKKRSSFMDLRHLASSVQLERMFAVAFVASIR